MKIKEKSKFSHILIWSEESNPPDFEGLVFLWNVYKKSTETIISIPYELEVNAVFFRERYLDLIDRISIAKVYGREIETYFRIDGEFSLWWMNLVFEKNYGKSNSFSNSIKLTVFEFYTQNFEVTVLQHSISTTKDLLYYFKVCSIKVILFDTLDVSTEKSFKILFSIHSLKSYLQFFFIGLVSIFRYVWFCGGIQFFHNGEQRFQGRLHFYDYFFHLLTTDIGSKFKSAYWGNLPDLLERKELEVTFSHIYIPSKTFPKIRLAKEKVEEFNKSKKSKIQHRMVERITIEVLCKVILNYFKFYFIYLFYFSFRFQARFKAKEYRPALYLWKEMVDSMIGSVAIQNLFTFYTIKNLVKESAKHSSLVYLMENQNWEKVLVYYWKKYIGNQIIAVAHATVRFWDLRYSFRTNLSGYRKNECKPEFIVYNGSLSKKGLLAFGFKKKDLIPGEALRFLGLDSFNNKRQVSKPEKILLVFTDYLFSVSKFQLDLLEGLSLSYQILVKPHPACQIQKLDFPKLKFQLTMDHPEELLKKAAIVYTSNVTSAALEAYYLDLPVISARDPKEVNLSPLFGLNGVHFVSSGSELRRCIKEIENRKKKTKRNSVFYTSRKLEKWERILNI